MQESLSKSHGSQCGFCTPGFIMSMYTLLRNNPQPSAVDMENAFQGKSPFPLSSLFYWSNNMNLRIQLIWFHCSTCDQRRLELKSRRAGSCNFPTDSCKISDRGNYECSKFQLCAWIFPKWGSFQLTEIRWWLSVVDCIHHRAELVLNAVTYSVEKMRRDHAVLVDKLLALMHFELSEERQVYCLTVRIAVSCSSPVEIWPSSAITSHVITSRPARRRICPRRLGVL